jgi:DNA-binding beta-propeller fold protein YncE
VADYFNHRIQKFTSDGVFVKSWGSYGIKDGQLAYPQSIAIDHSGFVYVAHTLGIVKFTDDGTFVKNIFRQIGGNSQPFGVAVDPAGEFLYSTLFIQNRVAKFTTDGSFVKSWGSQGTGDGQFNNPVEISVDNSSFVYVTEFFNCRVQKFTSEGQFVTKFGSSGNADGQFSNPWGIDVDVLNHVYVSDFIDNNIQVFAPVIKPPILFHLHSL